MSKQPLLSESTQKRLLLLAGMSHFSDEVLTESKKDGIPAEPDFMGGEKSLKPAPGAKKTEGTKEPKDDKKKLNEEIPQDDTMEPAPVSPTPEAAPSALPPVEGAPAPGNSANVDLKKFAQEFANFLKSQGHEITFTVDGEDVAQEIGATEDEFGDIEPEAGFGDEAPPEESAPPSPAPEPEGPPEPEPKLESKEKQVAKLVYEEVLRTLTANAGINIDQAKKVGKVQVKLADKAKTAKK